MTNLQTIPSVTDRAKTVAAGAPERDSRPCSDEGFRPVKLSRVGTEIQRFVGDSGDENELIPHLATAVQHRESR